MTLYYVRKSRGYAMKVKTAELIGPALDWAVAKCEGLAFEDSSAYQQWNPAPYSSDWAQSGPIIEREGIDLYCTLVGRPDHPDRSWRKSTWFAKYHRMGYGSEKTYGHTPLIAAMRCYVASKLGDEVDVPEELI